jgi:predicted dehydrogenase
VRTGIVGSGFVARVHAAAVRALGGEVVAVSSRTRDWAEQLAGVIGGTAAAFDSHGELLREGCVDVVPVRTPYAMHSEQ